VLTREKIASVEDVRTAARALICFSPAMAAAERELKAMLYARLYRAPSVKDIAQRAREVTAALFDVYAAHPEHMPADWYAALPEAQPPRARYIADFIAGMTDRYALARHDELIGPTDFISGF